MLHLMSKEIRCYHQIQMSIIGQTVIIEDLPVEQLNVKMLFIDLLARKFKQHFSFGK